MHRFGLALLGSGTALLAACGGGGGGGGDSTSPVAEVAITATNARAIGAAVVTATVLAFDFGDSSGGELDPSAASALDRLNARAAGLAMARMQALSQSGNVRPAVAFGPETEPCATSGSLTLSGNIANPPDIGVGDRIVARFAQCDDGDGTVLDGRLELVIRRLGGDPLTDVFLIEADVEVDDLMLTEAGTSATGNGEFSLTLDTLGYPLTITALAGNLLELVAPGEEFRLTAFNLRLEEDYGQQPVPGVATASGTVAEAQLGGKVSFLTENGAPLVATGFADPHDGIIRITGAAGSRLRALVGPGGAVDLELDANGDGVVEEVIGTTWSELAGD